MEIYYFGHSSFKIKGKQVTLVTDPYDDPALGIKFPKVEADIVTISHSHSDHNAYQKVEGHPFLISEPGEYEAKGVSIFGFKTFHDLKQGNDRGENIIYLIEMDSLRICHLGDLEEVLDDQLLEEINGVDLLMIPVGGFYTLGPEKAVELIAKIEPTIVIPMHFKIPQMGKAFENLVSVEDFFKVMGVGQISPLPKLVISKDKLPEERQIILLERKNG